MEKKEDFLGAFTLSFDILFYIANISAPTYYSMCAAIPEIGRWGIKRGSIMYRRFCRERIIEIKTGEKIVVHEIADKIRSCGSTPSIKIIQKDVPDIYLWVLPTAKISDLPPTEEIEYCSGILHREGDLPAMDVIWRTCEGLPRYDCFYSTQKRWATNGVMHRADGPAQEVYKGGLISEEVWIWNGEVYRHNDLPSVTTYFYERNEIRYKWIEGNNYCRSEGPCLVVCDLNGKLSYQRDAKYLKQAKLAIDALANAKLYWRFGACDGEMSEEEDSDYCTDSDPDCGTDSD